MANNRVEKRLDKKGYEVYYIPEHPFASKRGLVFMHRLVAEQMLGRYLREDEEVHHINKIRSDNDPINLAVLTKKEHKEIHSILQRQEWEMKNGNSIKFLYCDCGLTMKEIGEELNITNTLVCKYLQKEGLTRSKKNEIPLEEEVNVVLLYMSGKTQQQIANIYGTSVTPVKRILKKAR